MVWNIFSGIPSADAQPVVTGWGDDSYGQIDVPPLTNVIAIAAGYLHSVALQGDGTVIAWGAGGPGSDPNDSNNAGQATVPVNLTNVIAVAAGKFHTLVLKTNGVVAAWGATSDPLGTGLNFGQSLVPASVTNAIAISAGAFFSLALRSNSTVVAWGDNSSGQTNLPAGLTNIVKIATGGFHSLALRGDGHVVAWGFSGDGETNVPVGLTGVKAIAAGWYHSLALESNGTIVAWGDNTFGQTNIPQGATNVAFIAAGYLHSLAVTSNGQLYVWGDTYSSAGPPARLFNVSRVATGNDHGLALAANNDYFQDRVQLTGTNVNFSGDNTGATGETNEPPQPPGLIEGGEPVNSVWFTWTAPFPGGAVIDVHSDFGAPLIAVYTNNSLATLGYVTADSSIYGEARAAFSAASNVTYQISIAGSSFDTVTEGPFTGTLVEIPPPANDLFANRTRINSVYYTKSDSFLGATRETGEPGGNPNPSYPQTLWWTWTAPTNLGVANFPVRLTARSPNWMPSIGVYTGSVVSALGVVPLTIQSNSITGGFVNFSATLDATFNAQPGTSYQISLSGYGADPSGITISPRFGDYEFRFNASGLTVTPTNFSVVNNQDGGEYNSWTYSGTILVANAGKIASHPLQVLTYTDSGVSILGQDSGYATTNVAYWSTNELAPLAPGQVVAVPVSGIIPAADSDGSTKADGYGAYVELDEQPVTNLWFAVDQQLIGYADWPHVTDNDGNGPGGGVVRLDPDFNGATTLTILTNFSILGPSAVLGGGSASYIGRAAFDDGTVAEFTNTEWTASQFTITNGFFTPGNVAGNTPVTLNAQCSFKTFLYTAAVDVVVSKVVPDLTLPTVNVTNLVTGAGVSNANFIIMGTAADNVGVSNVFYNLDNAGWGGVDSSDSFAHWSAPLTLTPGTNTFLVYAEDTSGNRSLTNTLRFVFIQNAPLTVTTNRFGWGTLNPNDNGVSLRVGQNYSITATALPGFIFTNWYGGTSLPLVFLTNGATVTFPMLSNLMLQADFVDVTKPALMITNLTTGMLVSNGSFTVMGRSWDNVGISNVLYNFNNTGWLAAAPGIISSNWSAALVLNPGTNTFAVFARDTSGNRSPTNTVNFQYVVSARLTVLTNNYGWGTLSPNDSGGLLAIGKNYSITALPGIGFAFTNWSGGMTQPLTVLTNKPAVTFTMVTNFIVQANFVDITKPSLIITNVTVGMLVSNGNFIVKGRSWDNVAISNVFYNFDNTGWLTATPGIVSSNWSASLLLMPGTNTVSVYARDTSGNLSPTNTVSFQYVVTAPLMALTNAFGWGMLSPNDNGLNLQVGRNYSITAAAGIGFAFTNWTGGTNGTLTLLTNKPAVTFMMESNLELSANFLDVTRPAIIVTNLTPGQSVSNGAFTVMGRSWDNVAISNVLYNFNKAGWTAATPGIVSSNWSTALLLNPGTNTISAYALDTSGNLSPTNTINFQYVVSSPLTVLTNSFGWGTLSPNDSGGLLAIGKNYSITAMPKIGFAFTNWSGGTNQSLTVLTNKPTVTFAMVTNFIVQANFVDITKPSLLITNATAGMLVSNGNLTVMGRSWDNVAISNVLYNFNTTGWVAATPGIVSSNWSAALLLNPGTNSFAVYAQDTGGNLSPTNTVSFQYVVTAPLMVFTNAFGWGTLSPNDNGLNLQIGRNYSITATAGIGFAFTNWTGGTNGTLTLLTNKPAVTFMMESNLELSANFLDVTRPSLLITNLIPGQSVSNGAFTVMGRSWDNVAISNVLYNFNNTGWAATTPGIVSSNWSTALLLNPGTNSFAVYAQDTSGNFSPTNTVNFQYVVTAPLTVITNSFGWGTLNPNDNGANLQIGRNYSITAMAGTGFAFTNWTGETNGSLVLRTNGAGITFMMQSNLVVSANFRDVTKPTLAITNITSGMLVSNGNFTAMGRSWDNVAISNVLYHFNNAGWTTATPGLVSSNWSAALVLNPGTNTISVCAQDTSGNLSPTNTVTLVFVDLFTLADYFPLPPGAQWSYAGTNDQSEPVDYQLVVVSTNNRLTLYTGPNPPHAYTTNSVQVSEIFLDPDTLATNESGYHYYFAGSRVGQYGDDLYDSGGIQLDGFRVDRGIIFPAQLAVGASVTNSSSAYQMGTNVGTFTVVLHLIENTNLTVPAGTFNDVLHVRETATLTGNGSEADDFWWARSVGLIQREGALGKDLPIFLALASSSLLPVADTVVEPVMPPAPTAKELVERPVISVRNFTSGGAGGRVIFNLTGKSGQVVVVEGSSDLIHWQPLQTNQLGDASIYYSDPQSTNYPARFYRVRTP